MHFDQIIIGQGLAGSLLAWQLIEHGRRVMVIDNAHDASASRIAAGLINPVTGKRLVKSKQVDVCLPAAIAFYQNLERCLGQRFFYPKPMRRIIQSSHELQQWHKRKADSSYLPYLSELTAPNSNTIYHDPLGSFLQLQTGYIDTQVLLNSLRSYFDETHCYIKSHIHSNNICFDNGVLTVNQWTTTQLIFCEGYQASNNPWFTWLPFQLAKGEILTLHTDTELPEEIINAGRWLLPMEKNTFKFGTTYQWNPLNHYPTTQAQQTLLAAINSLTRQPLTDKIIAHTAGIRPSTKSTLPFLGWHPQHPQLGIFNGFGSKGALMIPYYAKLFVETMDNHTSLPIEVDITQYWKDS